MYISRYDIKSHNGDRPITRDAAKKYLRVESSFTRQDDVIDMLIADKQEQFERYTGRFLQSCTLWAYPEQWCKVMQLPGYPVTSIDSIEYTLDGNTSTVASDKYTLRTGTIPCEIEFADDYTFPEYDTIVIKYKAGYAAGKVPEGIYGILYHQIYQHYDHRDDPPGEKETVAQVQMEKYKIKYY